jgi:hypothetical protein
MTDNGRFIELQAGGEEATFDPSQLDALIALGRHGIVNSSLPSNAPSNRFPPRNPPTHDQSGPLANRRPMPPEHEPALPPPSQNFFNSLPPATPRSPAARHDLRLFPQTAGIPDRRRHSNPTALAAPGPGPANAHAASPFVACPTVIGPRSGSAISNPSSSIVHSWSCLPGSGVNPIPGQKIVVLNPGLSFGTGHHPTTAFCLRQIARLHRPPGAIVIAGSGLWLRHPRHRRRQTGLSSRQAMDADPVAVRIALHQCTPQSVQNRVAIRQLDIRRLPHRPQIRFDVVCANLSADLLLAHSHAHRAST